MKSVTTYARLLILVLGIASLHASALVAPAYGDDEPDGSAAAAGPNLLIGKQAPELRFKAYGTNQLVDLADLQGKMVVVDFFLAETAQDLSSFDDITDVEHDYAKKGVVVLGVSLDTNQATIVSLLQKKNIDWPFDYDPMGWGGPLAQRWHVAAQTDANTYHYWRVAFVISPEGTVLWAGSADEVGRTIDKEMKDHPPQLVDPKILADAETALDLTQGAITENKLGEAYRQRAKIPDAANADESFAAKLKKADDKLQGAGVAALAAIDKLIGDKKYSQASTDLNDLANSTEDTPLAGKVKAKLIELQKNPEARAALQSEEKNAKADDLLEVAQKLQSDNKDVAAYTRFKLIVKIYGGTPAAKTSSDAIAAYDADPAFKKKLAGASTTEPHPEAAPGAANGPPAAANAPKADPARAKSLLGLANSYRDSGISDKAREKYQEVISQFPGTPQADVAKEELAKMGQ